MTLETLQVQEQCGTYRCDGSLPGVSPHQPKLFSIGLSIADIGRGNRDIAEFRNCPTVKNCLSCPASIQSRCPGHPRTVLLLWTGNDQRCQTAVTDLNSANNSDTADMSDTAVLVAQMRILLMFLHDTHLSHAEDPLTPCSRVARSCFSQLCNTPFPGISSLRSCKSDLPIRGVQVQLSTDTMVTKDGS